MDAGLNICILENDYGAVNVDMMLLSSLEVPNCNLEMVAGVAITTAIAGDLRSS